MKPINCKELKEQEYKLQFHTFDSDVAWNLGSICHQFARERHQRPVIIHIASSNAGQILFHACSRPGTTLDDAFVVKRKQATVLRFERSSYYMRGKTESSGEAFAKKYALSAEDYSAGGGGYPIRVKGVKGVVGVIVISGLSQEENHELAVDGIIEHLSEAPSESDYSFSDM